MASRSQGFQGLVCVGDIVLSGLRLQACHNFDTRPRSIHARCRSDFLGAEDYGEAFSIPGGRSDYQGHGGSIKYMFRFLKSAGVNPSPYMPS